MALIKYCLSYTNQVFPFVVIDELFSKISKGTKHWDTFATHCIWDTPCGIDRFEVAGDGCLESLLGRSFSAFLCICRQHRFEVIRFTPLPVTSLNQVTVYELSVNRGGNLLNVLPQDGGGALSARKGRPFPALYNRDPVLMLRIE